MPETPWPAKLSAFRSRARSAVDSLDLVYLVCPAGFPNYGDELIAEAWLRHLARHRPLATVVVDCGRPGQASLLLRHANRRAVFVNTLWELTLHAEENPDRDYIDAERPWEWVAEAASRFGVAPREGHGVELLLRAKTIHLLGGGYINSVWPHHVSLVAAVAEVSRRTGARAVASGLGLTPRVTGAAWERLIDDAAQFEVFDVRDQPSFDALSGVASRSFSGDDAWISPRLRPGADSAPRGAREVVLCAQQDLAEDFAGPSSTGVEALVEFLRATLDAWEAPGTAVTVVECIPGLDLAVADGLGDRLAGARRIGFFDVWRNGLPSGAGHTWLSTRFHPHLLAAAAGDSGVAIVPKPDYYGAKHASLIEAGSQWTVAEDGRTIPERPTAGGFPPERSAEAVAAKRELARHIYPIGLRLR
ncbi:MAG: polysaccharide pyruvyl transferase family protein [Gordonia sp. (in: high G+C Gram-positive bacteria)]